MQEMQRVTKAEQGVNERVFAMGVSRRGRVTTWLRSICFAHFAAEQFEVPGAVTVHKAHIW